MADDTGLVFVIDGDDYPAPSLDTFDMAERRVMFDLAGVLEEDFVRLEGEAEDDHAARVNGMTRHPGFMEALMHVAYQRGNPELKRAKVQALIEKTNFHEAIQKWAEADADDLPPVSESTSEPSGSSPTGSSGSNETSGDGSVTSSGRPGSDPESIGTSESDTSPTLVGRLSAV